MSNMKNGFSTLNRWLGKKNKEKSPAPNGKLSKSNTNLSISTTNISDTSQLEYNRIAPLPAITSNAPFEQTFRITVLLPKDQLYVARLGARVPLSKLLELACDHKSLDAEKYEFRNPVDPSQIYSNDLTIGAVGLCEIRLCHKSDSYDSFTSEEVMKLHRTSVIRDSLSSSEFSSRNSKHTTKTASPYSSSNSLNSMDSTGMNYTRTPISPPPVLPKSTPPKMAAPPRKKRAAPRPPSQIVIPEKSALVIEHQAAQTEQTIVTLKQQQETMGVATRKDYYASTPNLSSNADANGNCSTTEDNKNSNGVIITNGNTIEYSDCEYAQVVKKNARNLKSGSVQNLSTIESPNDNSGSRLPEPSPRKKLVQLKKKAAPAPPPRGSSVSNCGEDAISIASTTFSGSGTPGSPNTADSDNSLEYIRRTEQFQTPTAPIPVARESSTTVTIQTIKSSTPVAEVLLNTCNENTEATANIPKPIPRQTTTTLLNATPVATHHTNVSKVMLNRSPTPEPRSLVSESSETTERLLSLQQTSTIENDDNISKQADSGIGEPVPSPLPDSLPSEGSAHECKSTFESSSDDDEIIKTYNFKLGKTTVNSTDNFDTAPQPLGELHALEVECEAEPTNEKLTNENKPNTAWNLSIPISPPPNFADDRANQQEQTSSDSPITPKIVERPVLCFENLSKAEISRDLTDHSIRKAETTIEKHPQTPFPSPSSPINEIIDELSTILNENRMDTIIKRHDEHTEIHSAKPNTLSNFSISTLTTTTTQDTNITTATIPIAADTNCEEEKLYKKHGVTSNSGIKQLKSIARADSFHTTSTVNSLPHQNSTVAHTSNGLNSRSSSYMSLSKLDQNGGLNRRRSSSELSIGESPSLQSLEVIKTILNSRKNSLANSSDGESKALSVEETKITSKSEFHQTKATSTDEPIKTKELPKVYRYSGPPSINFSTWSERPKVQVAIKNEGDYIFGGKSADSQNAAVTRADVELRSLQTVSPQKRVTMFSEFPKSSIPPIAAPKPIRTSTTERMGIPDKEYRVPLSVKPLKDVTIENIEIRTITKSPQPKTVKALPNNETTSTTNKHQFTQFSNTSTIPRAGHNTNRFSVPSTAVNLQRSTSITQLEQKKSTQNENNVQTTAPFGQNTLRKTGFKEKILAKEEELQKQQTGINIINSTKSTKFINGNIMAQQPSFNNNTNHTERSNKTTFQKPPEKAFQSAKLELKLQDPAQYIIKQIAISKQQQSPRATTPKSAPPAPSPMPIILKSTAQRSYSATNSATSPTSGDQRDALLEAIRNFKRTELNRV